MFIEGWQVSAAAFALGKCQPPWARSQTCRFLRLFLGTYNFMLKLLFEKVMPRTESEEEGGALMAPKLSKTIRKEAGRPKTKSINNNQCPNLLEAAAKKKILKKKPAAMKLKAGRSMLKTCHVCSAASFSLSRQSADLRPVSAASDLLPRRARIFNTANLCHHDCQAFKAKKRDAYDCKAKVQGDLPFSKQTARVPCQLPAHGQVFNGEVKQFSVPFKSVKKLNLKIANGLLLCSDTFRLSSRAKVTSRVVSRSRGANQERKPTGPRSLLGPRPAQVGGPSVHASSSMVVLGVESC